MNGGPKLSTGLMCLDARWKDHDGVHKRLEAQEGFASLGNACSPGR